MNEYAKCGSQEKAALRAGMDRKTARKYLTAGKMPSELTSISRDWRTREDPFLADWPWLSAMLEDAPTLEAAALFEFLVEQRPGRYEPGQLRTFQRRVALWRHQYGESPALFFPQHHRPGEALQTDFTDAGSLGITIDGEAFAHRLCNCVLPYSNWQWATVCLSESMAAIRRGVQCAVFRLGKVPTYHQTDNSSAATHDLDTGKRAFNDDYVSFMEHLGMTPRTTGIGEKEQNGDVESANGALKRAIAQHLLLRGSCDFESVDAYQSWLDALIDKRNLRRCTKVAHELEVMRTLRVERIPEWTEYEVPVSKGATIRVKCNVYSVPARLVNCTVTARVYDDRIEVFYAGRREMVTARLLGRKKARIDYRHIIWSMVKKPAAFARYRYREELFPSLVFRQAYDALTEAKGFGTRTDLEYLRILHLAASTMQSEVELALSLLLDEAAVPDADAVKALVTPAEHKAPQLRELVVDLTEYDRFVSKGGLS